MGNAFYRFVYHRLLGWKSLVTVPFYDKCVICAAPHTSNWDLFFGKLFYNSLGRKVSFMMKKEWFFFPLGPLFKAMGGIPVDRSKKTSLVEQMAERFARGVDYPSRLIAATRVLMPSGNVEQDLHEIKQHFLQFQGKKPNYFAI